MLSRYDFNRMAHEYDAWFSTAAGAEYDNAEKKMVENALKGSKPLPGRKILEVGCGTGHWCLFFEGLGMEVKGIDISGKMIEKARGKNLNAELLEGDAHELPFEDGEFDFTAAITTLEFAKDPEKMLREMYRCTRKGGVVLVGSLNQESPLGKTRAEKLDEPYKHAEFFSVTQLEEMLENLGLKDVKVEEGCYISFTAHAGRGSHSGHLHGQAGLGSRRLYRRQGR
ncbi:MAG: methyltransferase domain-containing protein [Planctomycetota bacterium]|nr:methyltransferase domain-containing protein [Planctomycetota bacterium]